MISLRNEFRYIWEWIIGTLITLAGGYSTSERVTLTEEGHRAVNEREVH